MRPLVGLFHTAPKTSQTPVKSVQKGGGGPGPLFELEKGPQTPYVGAGLPLLLRFEARNGRLVDISLVKVKSRGLAGLRP